MCSGQSGGVQSCRPVSLLSPQFGPPPFLLGVQPALVCDLVRWPHAAAAICFRRQLIFKASVSFNLFTRTSAAPRPIGNSEAELKSSECLKSQDPNVWGVTVTRRGSDPDVYRESEENRSFFRPWRDKTRKKHPGFVAPRGRRVKNKVMWHKNIWM